MNDAEYETFEEHIDQYWNHWLEQFGMAALYDWSITYHRDSTGDQPGERVYMSMVPSWKYLELHMNVYAAACAEDALKNGEWNFGQLERWVVHELMHGVLDELVPPAENPFREAFNGHVERVCQMLALGIVKGRRQQGDADRRDAARALGALLSITADATILRDDLQTLEDARAIGWRVVAAANGAADDLRSAFVGIDEALADAKTAN